VEECESKPLPDSSKRWFDNTFSSVESDQSPNSQKTQTTSTPSSRQSVFVDAKNPNGVDSGIYVRAGSTLEVKASGRAVWKNIAVGNPTKYEECGPNGTPPDDSSSYAGKLYGADLHAYLCPTARKGALIAKVGDGPWFKVGNNFKGELNTSGRLIFAVNDVDIKQLHPFNWSDNDKGFQATVKVN
jgi:hypothetical protein